ncbi:bactofilin family protein [Bacillus salinus]|uniref:bactofilin family protein n=1 Tax=Bacillus sp. HMF5848 TaxID=2495421 RepID=UPI00163A4FA3|nr:polymer-forming cytoskeletal protein [Bacillus sp. HMF5848]
MLTKKAKVSAIDTIIGSGTTIEGNIKSSSSIRVDGVVKGEIHCEGDLTIGADGRVEHKVSARNIYVAGTLSGDIEATALLHVLATGHVSGDIKMNAIIIEEGGRFEGTSHMQLSSQNDNSKNTKGNQKNTKAS